MGEIVPIIFLAVILKIPVLYGIDTDDPRPPALLRHGLPFAAFGRTGADADRRSIPGEHDRVGLDVLRDGIGE